MNISTIKRGDTEFTGCLMKLINRGKSKHLLDENYFFLISETKIYLELKGNST